MSDLEISRNATSKESLEMVKAWDEHQLRHLKARRLTDKKLLKAAEEYAKELGIPTPLLYMAEEFPAMFGGKAPNAMAFPLHDRTKASAITFTRKQFTVHGYTPHGRSAVPKEVLFTLGHEMGHIKQGGTYLNAIRRYPPLVGIAGALAGLALLDMAVTYSRKKHKEAAQSESDQNIETALRDATQEEREKVKKLLYHESDSHTLKGPLGAIALTLDSVLKAGGYVAATAMGFAGGKFATRHLVLAAEFNADKVGAQLCGDPRAGIRTIGTFRNYLKDLPPEELEKLRKNITPYDKFVAYFDHAHPTDMKRFARLEEMAKKMEQGIGKTVSKAKTALCTILDRVPLALKQIEKSAVTIHIR